MTQTRGPWRIEASRTVYANPWLSLVEHEVIRPDGQPGSYGVVGFANRAIAILPVFENGDIMLVGQHRFPQDRYSWEIPEGGAPLDEKPLAGARRELKEETGLTATHWREILAMDLSNSVTDEEAVGFLATGLSEGEADPDGTEDLRTRRIAFRAALDEAMSGAISDALTVAMLLRAYYMAKEGELDMGLAAAMLQE